MTTDFYPITVYQARRADFPLHCDTICKVIYRSSCGLRWQYFACMGIYAVAIKFIIESLAMVKEVKIVSVENFND